ncbi:MAG: MarR family transcriptional regulator [Alphaproteobacteria bacterium]
MEKRSETALIAMRQILRATEMNVRKLAGQSGLTPSQLIILQIVGKLENAMPSQIAREASLTQATVTTLIDKLERRSLVKRRKDEQDKRRVIIDLTEFGQQTLSIAPDLLQDQFSSRFNQLAPWEQSMLIASLEKVASLLDAEEIDASPVLDVGAIDKPS